MKGNYTMNNKIKIDIEVDTNDLECRLKNLKDIAENINDAIDRPNININNCKNVYISVYPNDFLKD